MNFGLAASIILHLGVLAWAIMTIAATPPFKAPEPEPVEVAIVTPDDIVRLKQGSRAAKQLEAKTAPVTDQSTAKKEPPRPKPPASALPPPPPPPPPPPEPAKAEPPPKKDAIAEKLAELPPEPAPGPSPEELKRLQEQKKAEEEQQRIEAQKKAEAEKKRKEELERRHQAALKKKQEDAKRIAEAKRKADELAKRSFEEQMADAIAKSALRDLDPTKKPPPAGGAATDVAAKATGPVAGAATGRDNALTASQKAMIAIMMKQAVSRCWNINSGLDGIDKIVVELEVRLTPEGRLAQPPKVVNSGSGVLFADAANSALRALEQCQPYDLPREFYETGWRHMIVDFRPERNF